MLLADYHIVFIIISFIMLLFAINYIFNEPYKEGIIAGALICSINWVICLINYMSFFAVGLSGSDSEGVVTVTMYSGMHSFFILFFAMQWINLILIFICWYKWMGVMHTENEEVEKARSENIY